MNQQIEVKVMNIIESEEKKGKTLKKIEQSLKESFKNKNSLQETKDMIRQERFNRERKYNNYEYLCTQ